MSQVGPIGVTPSPSPPVDSTITGDSLPSMIVVPSRDDSNGCVCATESAYHPAARHETTITQNPVSAASATRLRSRRRPASAQGLRPTTRAVPTSPAAATTSATRSRPGPVHYWTQAFENIM